MSIVDITPFPWPARGQCQVSGNAFNVLDATGESWSAIGYLHLEDKGAGGSRTISAAGGGSIIFPIATPITFSDVTTEARVGIQDVAATGFEDDTFDVYASLVPGTFTITANSLHTAAMSSGTKTMSHGDLIAIVFEMTTRNGTDILRTDYADTILYILGGLPYGVIDISGSKAKNNNLPLFMIQFDDSSYGWISFAPLLYKYSIGKQVNTFASNSTPDEYCGAFQVPIDMEITAMGMSVGAIATTDTFEAIFYTDPFGTPAAAVTFTPDPDQMLSGDVQWFTFATPQTLTANTWYAIALRPTTTNTITWGYYDQGTGYDFLKTAQQFSALKNAARTNQTGAFVETQVYHVPDISILISGIEVTTPSATETAFTFIG